MAVTLRFRPVLFGRPERPTGTAYLVEEHGRVFLRDSEATSRQRLKPPPSAP